MATSPSPSPVIRSAVPRLAAVVRGVAPRKSVMSRFPQLSKPVTVVPYAPERLSITQSALNPDTIKTMKDKGIMLPRKEGSVATLFAALRMRRVLHRVQAEHESSGPRAVVDETKANLERHLKVLSRYKIRQVDTDGDEARHLRNLPPFMVNPHSALYKIWQLITLIIIIYQSIMLPFNLAFGSNDTTAIDILMSSIFALDIIIAFNTPVVEDTDEMSYIMNRWHIASIYLRGWFFFDLLACTPFDYILLLVNNSKSNLSVLGLLKALRVPRLLRLVRLLRVAKVFKIRPELRRWLQYSRHANLLRLVRLVVSFLVINHYVACFWFGLVMSDETRALDPSTDSLHLYIVAFYSTLLVVMGQNITVFQESEYLFCILAMVVGAVLMAVVFGNVAILIANYYESQSSHQKKMEWLFASMNRMKLPYDLQNRITAYYQAMWERHGTLDGAVTAFIPELSRNLAYEVELFLRMDMINRAPIFQNCSAKVVQELVMELELQVFMPGDYIVVRGEVGNDMYFVQNGLCEVTKEVELPPVSMPRNPSRLSQASQTAQAALHFRGAHSTRETSSSHTLPQASPAPTKTKEVVLKILGQGDYFGEIALLMNCKRTANVRAQVFSELCTLTREVFESISQRYLEDRNIIEKFIMDKYDPSMLQAAMKQSQEVSMRGTGPAAAAAAAASRTNNPFPRPTQPGSPTPSHAMSFGEGVSRGENATAKITGLLTKVLERIDHLEDQLGREAEARREGENKLRMSLHEATRRLSITSRSPGSSIAEAPKHPASLSRHAGKAVADEPERVSQRNLRVAEHLAELEAKEAKEAQRESPKEESKPLTTPEPPDELKLNNRALKALRSWRNIRRDNLSLGMRLRSNSKAHLGQPGYTPGIGVGIGVGGAGSSFRPGSASTPAHRQSGTRSISRTSDVFGDSALLTPEPELRAKRESGHEDENGDQFPADMLDDLANKLDQSSGKP